RPLSRTGGARRLGLAAAGDAAGDRDIFGDFRRSRRSGGEAARTRGGGRGFDYYTGVEFELHDATTSADEPLVAGGRYDGLLTRLGAPAPIPAVGFAAWIERLSDGGAA